MINKIFVFNTIAYIGIAMIVLAVLRVTKLFHGSSDSKQEEAMAALFWPFTLAVGGFFAIVATFYGIVKVFSYLGDAIELMVKLVGQSFSKKAK